MSKVLDPLTGLGEAELRAMLAGKSRRLDVRLALARRFVEDGRPGEAAGLLGDEKALSKGEGAGELHAEAGRVLREIGDFAAACRHFARAMLYAPSAALVRLHEEALARMAEDADAGLSPALKGKYFKGLERLRGYDPASAAEAFAKVALRAPRFAPAWIGWRGALLAKGDAAGAAALAHRWSLLGGPPAPVRGAAMSRRLGARGLVFDPREPFVRRKKEDMLARAASADELKALPDSFWTIASGGEARDLAPALTSDGAPDPQVRVIHRAPEVFLTSLADAALVGRGAVVGRKGELVYDLMPRQDPAKYGAALDGKAIRFDPAAYRDGGLKVVFHDRPAFLMAGPTDSSFGEWMLNFLPRLRHYRAAGLDCDLVISAHPMASAEEMLAGFGFDESRLIRHDPNAVSIFPTLYVPSWPMAARRPMDGLFEVQRSAEPPADAPRGRRLYVSRHGLGRRPLVNEAEVEALFERHGFEVVRPETLSVEDARRIFAYPACVAASYGSAILNLAFCRSRPQCLFLIPPERKTFLKQTAVWLSAMGQRFRYLVGEPQGEQSLYKIAPWSVDLAAVEGLIGRMLQDERRAVPAAAAAE